MWQRSELIKAALKNDTAPRGGTNDDGVTSDPTISGLVVLPEGLGQLRARFHDLGELADITTLVHDGAFVLNRPELEEVRGGPLDDGRYVLRLQVEDEHGTALEVADVVFVLDTRPPEPFLFEPSSNGASSVQLRHLDVKYHDLSGVDPASISPTNLTIKNNGRTITVQRVQVTDDGLYRYHYDGELTDGRVTVTFQPGEVSDIAGNVYRSQAQGFDFVRAPSTLNGVPQRASRLTVEPRLNPPYNEDSGGSVFLHSGEAFLRRVDLEIRGRGVDFRLERTYRSGWLNYTTSLGNNWDFNYNQRLLVVDTHLKLLQVRRSMPHAEMADVVRLDGRGREDLYARVEAVEQYKAPPGLFATLTREDGRFVERDRYGNTTTYETVAGEAEVVPMTRWTDRNGNTLQFVYAGGHLSRVIDTLDRRVEFFYQDELLTMVRDFSGREVTFSYDETRNLRTVTGPRVAGTPHGNDFPSGKTEAYTYDTDNTNPLLYNNLVTVTAPNEVARGGPPRETYIYNEDGRVVEHRYGGTNSSGVPAGGSFHYRYLRQAPVSLFAIQGDLTEAEQNELAQVEVPTTVVTDRQGNVTAYEFSGLGNWTSIVESSNRNVRADDPPYFRQIHSYDDDGQRLTVSYPERNSVEYTFDTTNPDPLQRGNLLQMRRRRDGHRGGDQTELRTSLKYEPIYNQVRETTDPRGNDATHRSPILLVEETFPNPQRFTTRYIFDYQEGTNYTGLAAVMGISVAEVQLRLERAGIAMGLGDVNGDGRTDQIAGNVVRIEHATVNLPADSNEARAGGSSRQDMVELLAYNAHGQPVRYTNPERNVTAYEYYSADPGAIFFTPGEAAADGASSAGYLRRLTRDVSPDPVRNSGCNPPPVRIRTSYKYDAVGNVVQLVDGRGVVTDYAVNELNQVVQVARATDVVPQFDDEIGLAPGSLAALGDGVLPTALGALPNLVSPLHRFGYLRRYWYDFNDNVVLDQREDRGNTSSVDGNVPGLHALSLDAVLIDFAGASDTAVERYAQNGFVFSATATETDGQSLPSTGPVRSPLQLVTVQGSRRLKLSSGIGRVGGMRITRESGAPFTLDAVTVEQVRLGDGEWLAQSSAGDRQVLRPNGKAAIGGTAWTGITWIDFFAEGEAGDLMLGDFSFSPNPDPPGGERAFADTLYKYDILDNLVEALQEVRNGAAPHFVRTRYRYDANENLALTIFPSGNASTVVYDERDLPFLQGRGERQPELRPIESGTVFNPAADPALVVTTGSWVDDEWAGFLVHIREGKGTGQLRRIVSNTRNILRVNPPWQDPPDRSSTYEIAATNALLKPTDPIDYDVRGGLTCDCSTYTYDGNRNVVRVRNANGNDTQFLYDHFDRLVSTIDSLANQAVYQYDAADNRIRELRFGPPGAQTATVGAEVVPSQPVSVGGIVQAENLITPQLLAATEFLYDEASRQWETDQVLFVNSTTTRRPPDVAAGVLDLGKRNLLPGGDSALPGVDGPSVLGRVATRSEYDRNSRLTYVVENDGDTLQVLYDGVDRAIMTIDAEGNSVESTFDGNHNLLERRHIEVSQGVPRNSGSLVSGVSTGESFARTLSDTTQAWRRFEWAGRTLCITGGTGAGQTRAITDNAANQLTVDRDWDVVPDGTSSYAILPIAVLIYGHSTGFNTVSTLNDASAIWTVGEWTGRSVEITGGQGVSQVRTITDNNQFQLFVEPPWDFVPDDTSRYAIYPAPQPGIIESFLTTHSYDSLNRLQRVVDNLGQATSYRYDSRDNLVAVADAQGPVGNTVVRRSFSAGARTVNTINDFGNVTLNYYDGIDRLTHQEMILTASGSGDGEHIGASIEGIKNLPATPESFPPAADLAQASGDGVIRLGSTYDDNSLVSAHLDDRGHVSLYLYDNLDRRVTETKGLRTSSGPLTKQMILDDRNIFTPTAATIDNPATIPADKIDIQLGDAKARIDAVEPLFPVAPEPDDTPTTIAYGYDAQSNLLIAEDEIGSRVYLKYDSLDRPLAFRAFRAGQNDTHQGDPIFAPSPSGGLPNGNPSMPPTVGTTKQDFEYDGLSRLVTAWANNNPDRTADNSHVIFAYDSLSRVLEEHQKLGDAEAAVVSTAWRSSNLRSALTYPNGRRTEYTYDKLDRLKSIGDAGAVEPLVTYSYIGPHRVLERAYPINGTRLTHLDDHGTSDIGYDGLGRPSDIRHLRSDNSDVVGFSYTHDRVSNKLTERKLHSGGDSELCRYDSQYRVRRFERGMLNAANDAISVPSARLPQHGQWEFDGAGNWLRVDGETREHSSHNETTARNLADGTSVVLIYDDGGNLVDDGSNTYQWDVNSRLCRVRRKSDSAVVAVYTYDALGRRVREVVTNTGDRNGTAWHYFDGHRQIEDHRVGDGLVAQYVHGNYLDEMLVMDRNVDGDASVVGPGDQRLFYHQNDIMHVHALTDNNGSILEGYLYDAYGRHTVFTPGAGGSVEFGDSDAVETGAPSALGNIWLFTGRQFDAESGLLFYRSRYLNPSLGRFISRDPHDPWSNLKNLGNGYPYAVNSAVNWVDPFGLEASDWTYNAGEPFIDSFGNQCQTAYWSRETVVEGNPTIEIQEIGTTCQSSGGFGGRISRPHLMSPTPPIRGGPGPKPNKPTPPQPPTEASQKVPECFKEASREHQNCRAKCAMTAMKDTTGTGVDVGSHAMAGGGIGYAIGKWGLPAAATLLAPELLPVAVKWGGRIGMVVGGGVGAVVGWITADTPGDCRDECFLTLQLAWVGCYAKNS